MTKVSEFIEGNIKWVVVILFGIIVIWLNTNYVTRGEYNDLQGELTDLKESVTIDKSNTEIIRQAFIKEQETIDERLTKKIQVINKNRDNITSNKISIEVLKCKMKWN